jgi:quinol monooxygenase YgiN
MLIVVASLKILPDKTEEWQQLFARRRDQVLRDEEYTLRYELYQSTDDACDYITMEAFRGAQDHDRHLKASIGHEAMMACFAEAPVIRTYVPVGG